MSVLGKIVEKKRERLSEAKRKTPLARLKAAVKDMERPRDFQAAIKNDTGRIRLIAEIKKASPSKGLIREDFDYIQIATIYENKNVDAISVITEKDFFQGRIELLAEVKKVVSRPILRKDFLFDEYQIYEARAYSADALLLIAAVLDMRQAEEYLHLARELGMSVLFEVHDFMELEMALKINAPVIGINNRSLKTLKIDLNTSMELSKEIPKDRIVVSESGIRGKEDVLQMESAGIDAMLVGTCFMESRDIGRKIDDLRNE